MSMTPRPLRSRWRRRAAVALPAALSVAALAPAANAATVVFTPTDGASFTTAANTADTEPANTQSIIQLVPTSYLPTVPITLGSTASPPVPENIEITGNPKYQVPFNGQQPILSGQNVTPSTVPFVTAVNGSTILLKAMDLAAGGSTSGLNSGGILVQNGARVEQDNTFNDSGGTSIIVVTGGYDVVNNSLIGDGFADGVENQGGTIVLNNDTFAYNGTYNISGVGGTSDGLGTSPTGTTILHNVIMADAAQDFGANSDCGGPLSTTGGSVVDHVLADDSSCGPAVTVSSNLNVTDANGSNGGPTYVDVIPTTSDAASGGDPAYCAIDDQRFFLTPAGSCPIGSYNPFATDNHTSTTAPVCTITGVSSTTNPQFMTVNAQDSGTGASGLGPDAISNVAITNTGTTFGPGTVSYNTAGGVGAGGVTPFDQTNPTGVAGSTDDYPSFSPFQVKATKQVNDSTSGDTKWSFTATDWLGNATACH